MLLQKVSIPTGSIKIATSVTRHSLKYVSIPTGSIKILYYFRLQINYSVSIPTGSIKIALQRWFEKAVRTFQFQLVRLKFWRTIETETNTAQFQFQLVRLKLKTLKFTYRSKLFQFQLVRLKWLWFCRKWDNISVSIPTGSIKIIVRLSLKIFKTTFQFQLVRLKFPQKSPDVEIPGTFQFQLVRLKYAR